MSAGAKSSLPAGSNRVAIALGSNIDDRQSHLDFAVSRLGSFLSALQVSSFHDTEPVGVSPQARFLNGAVTGHTTLPPRAVLTQLMVIELERGRTRPYDGAPRTLDLDLILYGQMTIDEPGLRVPHRRFREREFVLEPLSEIAGDWIDPETGRSVAALLEEWRATKGKRSRS
jgi:2-amino-4-hydroxy-6-hydroxymethyldihydropteridine diphosphokinase